MTPEQFKQLMDMLQGIGAELGCIYVVILITLLYNIATRK